ncbi:hypothetical protein MKW94_018941 [Papaver nudicaule]|uniref:MADS-box domain-containing protein n=1 Tax=Papaver nudicaule TaxID=74823 RepID=A0AA41VJY8_PAPNU|nr:hypothetical protein [Papaver nudicaule]
MARLRKRGKISLAYIKDRTARRDSFRKRSQCLVRKVHELYTLCGVDGCAIMYGPFDPKTPKIWPEDTPKMHHILMKFKSRSVENRNKKGLDHQSFMKIQITKSCPKIADIATCKSYRGIQWNPKASFVTQKITSSGGMLGGGVCSGGMNGGVMDYNNLGCDVSTVEDIDQMINEMMMEGGVTPPTLEASFGGGTLEDTVNSAVFRPMPANRSPKPC